MSDGLVAADSRTTIDLIPFYYPQIESLLCSSIVGYNLKYAFTADTRLSLPSRNHGYLAFQRSVYIVPVGGFFFVCYINISVVNGATIAWCLAPYWWN